MARNENEGQWGREGYDNTQGREGYDYSRGREGYEHSRSREAYEERDEPSTSRFTVIRRINGIITLVCGLFAAVLAVHIFLFVFEANFGNPFAAFVSDWARMVSLGLGNLFLPTNEKAQIALNQGIAAILWLVIGWLVTTIIARILLPYPDRTWYRRPQ
ncbi:hypothetical protein SAMN06265360_101219 [Haloechinothrix alba]|uniref:YggT family protein n=1 Tax=Haloechinothrix alba TaxID=664784 RepID=A0A238V2G5_9PSEU|nr:hypothetical protein [Haloechinothrix alba]SNR28466.1 hypothetical protein SAMN06265360_101219 [Haloechinothrix alba]